MLEAKVIVNPVAGGYSTRRKWTHISKLLQKVGLSFDYEFTEGVGHGIELARAAVSDGYRYLIAVGGDGTVNEVANGILHSPLSTTISLGIISTGTGCSFVRSVGIPRDYARACSRLTSPRRLLIDVGLVRYKGQSRFFTTMAGVGFDAAVVEAVKHLPEYFSGTNPYLPYIIEVPRTLFNYQSKSVTLHLSHKVEAISILSVVAANGDYFGGGMHMAPQAKLNDGLLDVVIIGNISKFELLTKLPTIYKGTHINHPKVRIERTTHIAIESPERVLVQADGELLGEGPVSFWVVPAALSIVV